MDNSNTMFPFNGQFPNMNMNEINRLMKQFSQLMEGDLMESLQRLSQLQTMIPQAPGVPIMPLQPNTGNNTSAGSSESSESQSGSTGATGPMSPPFTPNFNMGQLNAMMQRLQHFLNNDLMRNMYNLQAQVPTYANANPVPAQNKGESIPIQIWENDRNIYVLASLPGVKNSDDVKVTFLDDKKIRLRTKAPSYRPERNSRIVQSDFPKQALERLIELPQAVSPKTYSASFKEGLYTLTLNKLEDDYEISIFEE